MIYSRVWGERSPWQRQRALELESESGTPPSWELVGTPNSPCAVSEMVTVGEGMMSCRFLLPRSRWAGGKVPSRCNHLKFTCYWPPPRSTSGVGAPGAGHAKNVCHGTQASLPYPGSCSWEPAGSCWGKPKVQEPQLWPLQWIFNDIY